MKNCVFQQNGPAWRIRVPSGSHDTVGCVKSPAGDPDRAIDTWRAAEHEITRLPAERFGLSELLLRRSIGGLFPDKKDHAAPPVGGTPTNGSQKPPDPRDEPPAAGTHTRSGSRQPSIGLAACAVPAGPRCLDADVLVPFRASTRTSLMRMLLRLSRWI